MKINEVWEDLREKSYANIQSEKGILKRQTRSIQTEGHFGDIKENEDFRRFNYRSSDKIYKEYLKENYRRKQHKKKFKDKISAKGVLCPKIDSIIEKQNILTKSQSQNALYLSGYFYFALREVKLLISRQPLFILFQYHSKWSIIN